MKGRFLHLFGVIFFFIFPSWAEDLITELLPTEKSPRPLTSLDLNIHTTSPWPYPTVRADFNSDGVLDEALLGIYNLPSDNKIYFFLVGTPSSSGSRGKILYFEEFDHPVYLWEPGTTGPYDPKDQSFSLSLCLECDKGYDFYWRPTDRRFYKKPWSSKLIRTQKWVEEKTEDVPEPIIDEVLMMVGKLRPVQIHINELKISQSSFRIRVEWWAKDSKDRVRVKFIDMKKGREIVWNEWGISLITNTIFEQKKK